jgi:hypothetical protein
LLIGDVVSLNFDEYVISIGADWSGRLFGSSEQRFYIFYEKK